MIKERSKVNILLVNLIINLHLIKLVELYCPSKDHVQKVTALFYAENRKLSYIKRFFIINEDGKNFTLNVNKLTSDDIDELELQAGLIGDTNDEITKTYLSRSSDFTSIVTNNINVFHVNRPYNLQNELSKIKSEAKTVKIGDKEDFISPKNYNNQAFSLAHYNEAGVYLYIYYYKTGTELHVHRDDGSFDSKVCEMSELENKSHLIPYYLLSIDDTYSFVFYSDNKYELRNTREAILLNPSSNNRKYIVHNLPNTDRKINLNDIRAIYYDATASTLKHYHIIHGDSYENISTVLIRDYKSIENSYISTNSTFRTNRKFKNSVEKRRRDKNSLTATTDSTSYFYSCERNELRTIKKPQTKFYKITLYAGKGEENIVNTPIIYLWTMYSDSREQIGPTHWYLQLTKDNKTKLTNNKNSLGFQFSTETITDVKNNLPLYIIPINGIALTSSIAICIYKQGRYSVMSMDDAFRLKYKPRKQISYLNCDQLYTTSLYDKETTKGRNSFFPGKSTIIKSNLSFIIVIISFSVIKLTYYFH